MLFTTRPTLQGTFGMVSSTHWLASQSAMAVLEDGGNAYDAAVAAGFVLHVVEPHLNGPAGEVPIILAPADGPVRVLCGQGVAPPERPSPTTGASVWSSYPVRARSRPPCRARSTPGCCCCATTAPNRSPTS